MTTAADTMSTASTTSTTSTAAGAERRRRGRPGYDRDEVLASAVAAFNEHGYDATTMGMLADRLGVTKSATYHHFSSKEALLAAALDEALNGLEAALEAALDESIPAGARLRTLIDRAVHVLVDRLPYVTLLLRVRGNCAVERQALGRRRAFDRAVAELVVEAATAGELRADIDPALAERLLFGMINSITEWYRPDGPHDAGQLAEALSTLAFDGLAAFSGRERARNGDLEDTEPPEAQR